MREGLLGQAGMRIQQLFPTVCIKCLPRETVGLEKIAVSRYLKIQDLMKLPLQWGETQREKSMSSVWGALKRANNEGLGNARNWGGAENWIKFTWTETWKSKRTKEKLMFKGPEWKQAWVVWGMAMRPVWTCWRGGLVWTVFSSPGSGLHDPYSWLLSISDIFAYHLQILSHS